MDNKDIVKVSVNGDDWFSIEVENLSSLEIKENGLKSWFIDFGVPFKKDNEAGINAIMLCWNERLDLFIQCLAGDGTDNKWQGRVIVSRLRHGGGIEIELESNGPCGLIKAE